MSLTVSRVRAYGRNFVTAFDEDRADFEIRDSYASLVDAWRHLDNLEKQAVTIAEVLHQRLSLEEAPDWHFSVEHTDEVVEVHKFYEAVDAVVLGFMRDIFGAEWITKCEVEKKAWLPLVYVRDGYTVSDRGDPSFATVSRADLLFRSRFWSVLAHEIAHMRIRETMATARTQTAEAKAKRFCRALEILKAEMRSNVLGIIGRERDLNWIPEAYESVLEPWAVEFTCDAVAALIAGPAFLLSYVTLAGPDIPPIPMWCVPPMTQDDRSSEQQRRRHKENVRREALRALRQRHPSNGVRHRVLAHTLEAMGFGEWLRTQGFDEYEDFARSFVPQDLNPTWSKCMEVWIEAVDGIATRATDAARELLPDETRLFDTEMFEAARDVRHFESGPMPRHAYARIILNSGWIMREQHLSMTAEALANDVPLFRAGGWTLVHNPGREHSSLHGGIVRLLSEYLEAEWREIVAGSTPSGEDLAAN